MIARLANSFLGIFTRGLFGPVFQREVRVAGRRASTYWVRGLYVLGLTVLAALVYFAITADTRFSETGNAEALQQLQMFAPTLGAFFVWFQFVAMSFVASTLTAGAICDERRKGSLSALFTTPLSHLQIILGKMSGRLIQLFVLLACGFPLLLAARIFGGISTQFILAAFGLTLCVSLLHASIALSASASQRNSASASGTGFVGGVIWGFFPMLVSIALAYANFTRASMTILALSPYFSLGMETADSFGVQGGPPGLLPWYYSAIYSLAGSVFFLILALYRCRILARTGGEPLASKPAKAKNKNKPEPAQLPQTVSSASTTVTSVASSPVLAATIEAIHSTPDPLVVGDNPILWRELRQQIFQKPWHARIAFLGLVLLLLFIYSQTGWAEPTVLLVFTAILFALYFFQATVIASNSVAGERESRSLEVLLTTPLSAWDIVLAKWAGSLRRLLPIPAFYFPFLLICGILSGKYNWILLPHLLLISTSAILFLVATGVWFSVVTRRATVAATLNIILGLTLWVALPLVAIAISAILQPVFDSNIMRDVLSPFLIAHPAAMTLTALEGAAIDLWGSSRSNRYETFLPFSVWTFSLAVAGAAIFFTTLSWLVLRLAARSLARRTNRAR